MDLKRNLVWIIPLILIVSAPLWWDMAGTLLEPRGDFSIPPQPSQDQLKRFTMEGVTLSHCNNGRNEFVVNADSVSSTGQDDRLQLFGVRAEIVGEDGPTIISSGEAFFHTGRQILTMLDRVSVKMAEGQEIKTEALRYLVKYRKVKTAEDVEMNGNGVSVRGTSMFYDLAKGFLRVGGRVVVDLY